MDVSSPCCPLCTDTDRLWALLSPHRQGGQKSKAEPFSSPRLAMTSNSEIAKGLCVKPQSPHLKSIIRVVQITCACLEMLKTHPHFTEVPTGMRWLPRCLFLQSIRNILFPLEYVRTLVSHLFCTEATSFLFLEERGDEHRLITITMMCYATAQAPEVQQTPRLGFLTSSVCVDIYVCAGHLRFPSLQAETGTPRAQFIWAVLVVDSGMSSAVSLKCLLL